MTLPYLASETLDAVYLHAMLQHFDKVLWRARHEVSFFRREIESLTKQEIYPDSEILWRSLHQNTNLSPELIAAAQHAIVQINKAEDRLVRVVESGQKALLEHTEQGLIDWTMPFDYEFSLLLDPGEDPIFL